MPANAERGDRGGSEADTLAVALVHETFPRDDGPPRLERRLVEARSGGAELAVLPELPLHAWSPAEREPRRDDAEPPEGPRHRTLAAAAREAGIAVLGGVIVRDPSSGRRTNRALLLDARGDLLGTHDKLHLPAEPGFWEADHYEPGDAAPRRLDGLALPVGIQLCSDANRPQGCLLLGAQGVAAILVPRATPRESHDRWRTVLRANAITSAAYVISVNRPGPEAGVGIGGPSVAIAPDGRVLVETDAPLSLVQLERTALDAARREYPGYLTHRTDLYARAWAELAESEP